MLRRYNSVVLFFVGVLALTCLWLVWPQKPANYIPFIPLPGSSGIHLPLGGASIDRVGMRLGLDLQGGTSLLLQADLTGVDESRIQDSMEGLRQIIVRRVNAIGVSEPVIQIVGDDRLSVQLAGIDVDEAKRLVGQTAQLEFQRQIVDDQGNLVIDEVGTAQWEPAVATGSDGEERALTGEFFLPNAALVTDQTGLPQVAFEFNDEGAILFEQITTDLVARNERLGIFLDGALVSAPRVNAVLSKRGVITGLNFEQGRQLVIQLNAGALPVPVEIIKETTVDATLGSDSVRASILAGEIGFGLILLFMVLYYRLPGLLAGIALVVYALVTLALFKMIPVTLTLAGIGGFILSVGMAVDANILIFERTREELRWGKTLSAAVEAGFDRAWSAIRDSNVSTLITCLILWWYGTSTGTSIVAGFALTLGIGVLVSMFSAVVVTRSLLRALIPLEWARSPRLFAVKSEVARADQAPQRPGWLDFVRRRYVFLAISAAFIIPGIASMLIPPAFEPGIEFSSGSSLTIEMPTRLDPARVRQAVAEAGFDDAIIQRIGDGTEFLIRTRTLDEPQRDAAGAVLAPGGKDRIVERLETLSGSSGGVTVLSADTVSAIIAEETVRNAALAVALASVGIMLYVWWAFRSVARPFRYAVAAIVALVHDSVLVLGLFSIFGKLFGTEIDSLFITALLAVIGFSVNDTIVVFDRIRENLRSRASYRLSEAVNESLIQTLGRSLNTTLTAMIALTALLLFGGVTIGPFVVVLMIGFFIGTYSSIFIASQVLVIWDNGELTRFFRRRGASSAEEKTRGGVP